MSGSRQPVPPRLQGLEGKPNGAARAGGFSLHAGVDIAPNQREKLERLALTTAGQVRYTLKTSYRDGTTFIVLEPLDLMARLAALVPMPRSKPPVSDADPAKPSSPRHVAMSWARRLKRVFGAVVGSSRSSPASRRHKALSFCTLVYELSNWQQLERHLRSLQARPADIVSVWIIRAAEDTPRFVTAYPKD